MFFEPSQGNLNAWKTEMHMYEKSKRTKKPFGKTTSQMEYVTHEKIKNNECRFNPVLQSYTRAEDEGRAVKKTEDNRAKSLMNNLKQTLKYQKSFDIVNLHSNDPYTEKSQDRKLGPIRNAYNVINNQKLPDYFFEKRQIKLPVQRNTNLLSKEKREYNIVTTKFKEDHQRKIEEEIDKEAHQVHQKYWKTHNYDPVYGKFYNEKKEEKFIEDRSVEAKEHGKDVAEKMPPSYVYREPLIIDYSKPLPEPLKVLDERNKNEKKRYQTRYVVLDEYSKRNMEDEDRQAQILTNHVHFGRVLDEKEKEFNIINNNQYKATRAEDLYRKKLQVESWDKLMKEASRPPPKSAIKTGGF